MTLTFDTSSPERGWPPFMDWLKAQGVDPNSCRSISVREDGSATAVVFARGDDGLPLIDGDELVTRYQRIERITEEPPRRISPPVLMESD